MPAIFGRVKKKLYLVHGRLRKNSLDYTGLVYTHLEPIKFLESGEAVPLDDPSVYTDSITLKSDAGSSKLLLINQGWLDIRTNPDTPISITYRIVYPYSSYFSGTYSKIFRKFQDYTIMNINFHNTSTDSIDVNILLNHYGHELITYNNIIDASASHTILFYDEDPIRIIRVKDLTPWLQ